MGPRFRRDDSNRVKPDQSATPPLARAPRAQRRAQAGEIRQSEMQQLGLLARDDRRRFARSEIERGERTQRLTTDATRAARDHVDAFAAGDIARAGVEPEQSCFAAPLGEYAEQLLRDAGRAFDRHPLVVRRVHEDRLRIARLGIVHGPAVRVFPNRLVAIDIALALDVGAPAEGAVLELALFSELAHSDLHLGLREIAAAAGAAELQHDGLAGDVGVLALGTVIDRLREIADHAGDELAVATVVERAFELVADLLEIVPVARRVEIAAHLAERELEIVERMRLTLQHDAAVEDAAAMLEAALEGNFIGLHDLHGFLRGGGRARTPRTIAGRQNTPKRVWLK